MATERCTQCGTARRGDMQVCVRCETPFSLDADIDVQRPAAPSKVQTHGTMAAGVVLGVVLMMFVFAFSVRDVGPFKGEITSQRASAASVTVTVRVSNDGDRAGHGNCRVRALNQSNVLTNVSPFLTKTIAGNTSISQDVEVPISAGRPAEIVCN